MDGGSGLVTAGPNASGGRQSRLPDSEQRPGSMQSVAVQKQGFLTLLFGERGKSKKNSWMFRPAQADEA